MNIHSDFKNLYLYGLCYQNLLLILKVISKRLTTIQIDLIQLNHEIVIQIVPLVWLLFKLDSFIQSNWKVKSFAKDIGSCTKYWNEKKDLEIKVYLQVSRILFITNYFDFHWCGSYLRYDVTLLYGQDIPHLVLHLIVHL